MKKIILTAVFSSISFFSFSQEVSLGNRVDHVVDKTRSAIDHIRYGGKLALNFAGITGIKETEMTFGFDAGVFGNIPVVQEYGVFFQPELLFSKKGFKPKAQKESVSNSYIDVPLMLQFAHEALKGGFIEIGPKFGFAVSTGNYKPGKDQEKKAKNFDFGLAIGAGVNVGRYIEGLPGLSISGRYNIGFTDVYDISAASTDGKSTSGKISNKNSVGQVILSYTF